MVWIFMVINKLKTHHCLQGLIDQLQGKIRSYKKQIEEAEEIAALNLAKFRQTQAQLHATTDAAEANEQRLAKTRARSSSLAPVGQAESKPLPPLYGSRPKNIEDL